MKEVIEKHIQDQNIDFINTQDVTIDLNDLKFKGKRLKALSDKNKQQRLNAFMEFNKIFLKTIPFVYLDEDALKEMQQILHQGKPIPSTLSFAFLKGKNLAFQSIKMSFIKNIVNALQTDYGQTEIAVKRRVIQRLKDEGKVDHKGELSMFGQIRKKLKENNYQTMRKNDADSQAWRINFIGEGSIDAGGPFRESITNMCEELMSDFLPLFIKSQNNKNDHGMNRDCWTINPAATSPVQLEMYEFLGALMGYAFRSGSILDVKLTPFFYRGLTGEPLDVSDLRAVDAYAVQAVKDLENAKK